ncbi:hypothetical protein K488DRAFT_25458, partial [Vararia minispora EC-137]
ISGRSADEETRWWDPAAAPARALRPGSGVLAVALAERAHNPEHTLYAVQVECPRSTHASRPSTSSEPPEAAVDPSPPPPPPPNVPMDAELRAALPHPDALYCRKHNGWALLTITSSGTPPPLAPAFLAANPAVVVPHRAAPASCVDSRTDATHHFHVFERAVAGLPDDDPLLDLSVCCQCSTRVLCSDVVPGVVPVRLLDELMREKAGAPPPALARVPETAVLVAVETIINVIHNRLFRNEARSLPVTRPTFQRKLGWNRTIQAIFTSLGFKVEESDNGLALVPPSVDPDSPARAKLIRAWIELSAWAADWAIRFRACPYGQRADSARETYQRALGAHPDQSTSPSSPRQQPRARCDPARTHVHFTALYTLFEALAAVEAPGTETLQTVILDERTRGRWTLANRHHAARVLGFGRDGELGFELDPDVDDAFVMRAAREVIQRARGSEAAVRDVADALRVVGEARGSAVLRAAAERRAMAPEKAYALLGAEEGAVDDGLLITVFRVGVEDQPAQAAKLREALEVIAEYRDSERLRAFLKSGEDPGDAPPPTRRDWPRGLNQLGNTCYLNSLLQYFYTIRELRGALVDTGGRLGAEKAGAEGKAEGSKGKDEATEEELARTRVGGRRISRREIRRSQRFVQQLADLFFQMQCADNAAVTPTLELAKLALVSHRDDAEEDEEAERAGGAGTDSDATLVDDGDTAMALDDARAPEREPDDSMPAIAAVPTIVRVDSPVSSTEQRERGRRDVETPDREGLELPRSHRDVITPDRGAHDTATPDCAAVKAGPPPLPPRKVSSAGGMLFGRQHDLTECMDNCIFQIETALLKFGGMAEAEDDKTSLVKRLFYGNRKQRIVHEADVSGRQPTVHEREDPFFQLPINVSDEGYDLYDGLAGYFADAAIELEGRPARMETSIADLPPILQIQLQRAQFDRETLQSFKSQAYVRFGETLFMDRFLDGVGAEKRERSKAIQAELGACRDRIQQLTTGKLAPYEPALASTAEFLQHVDGLDIPELDDTLIANLVSEQDALTSELAATRARAGELERALEELWDAERTAEYELTSVFIHRGASPSFGHYFFYSRHLPEKPDEWFKYNDSEVSVVPKAEVLADTTGQTANPYMLVYVRKGADMIDTVDRID